jgi:serine/threonine protein kinase
MGEVYKQIKKNGLPYRVEVSEVCKKAIKWCLDFDPKKRPTCIELLSYLIDAKNKQLLKLQEKSAFEVK